MRCEIVAIGTELLLGQIVDTNSSWLGSELALAGIDSHLQIKVGDNLDRMVEVLRGSLERSDAVICCGGLGPTQDDITREALARVLGVELVFDEDRADIIRWMFRGRDRAMPANNLLQAHRPEGASFLETQPGTAPGLRCETADGKLIYAVPGVPWEMKEMFTKSILPDLRERAGIRSVIRSRTLRTWGESESGLAETLAERIVELDGTGNPTIAFLASGGEGIKVRITAKADDEAAVEAMLAKEEVAIRAILGDDLIFGVDGETMESVVIDLLRDRGLTVAVAESLTGGMIGARLTAISGASDVFRGGVISYASEVKFDLLGVEVGPVVSEAAAAGMAEGVRRVIGADVGLAVTGVAGPDELEGRPAGTVCMAVSMGAPDDATTLEIRLPGQRDLIRELTVISVLALLRRRLLATDAVA